MAPEVLNRQMHSYEVDYYAIGIIAHELMLGKVKIYLSRDLILETIVYKYVMPYFQSNI
jgi:serine/threonine protein kinase